MKFYSTRNKEYRVSLRDAVIRGLAPDEGLYMPEQLLPLPARFFRDLKTMSYQGIALEIADQFFGDDIGREHLERMIDHTIQFDVPLVQIENDVYALELFHGPTMAFKDFGARFMSQLLGYIAREEEKEIIILVATSGDTGSAVANGFLGVKGTRVIVLYPSGKVSNIQEKQFTTLEENVIAVEVDGTFDDCQRMVKLAFLDEELTRRFFLTSANSINIARLIPQTFYYFFALAQLAADPVVFSVPSGNFGNLTAGLMAKRMGLPVRQFVAATNKNDIVPGFLQTGVFSPRHSVSTISSAMDVGNPSNFSRITDLYNSDVEALRKDVTAFSISDEETRAVMKDIHHKTGYTMDPHGAVAYAGLMKFRKFAKAGAPGIFLETAHPGKFGDAVHSALGTFPDVPATLSRFLAGRKNAIPLENDFQQFKSLINERLSG